VNPPELIQLAQQVNLDSEDQFNLRIDFGVACIEHVEHLLTDNAIIECLSIGNEFVSGNFSEIELADAAAKTTEAAKSHPGSSSLIALAALPYLTVWGLLLL
jgi:hypothetical protein